MLDFFLSFYFFNNFTQTQTAFINFMDVKQLQVSQIKSIVFCQCNQIYFLFTFLFYYYWGEVRKIERPPIFCFSIFLAGHEIATPLPFSLSQFPTSISLFLHLLFCLKQYLLGTTTSMPGHLSPFFIVTSAILQDCSQYFMLQISSDGCKSTLSSIFNSFFSYPCCFPSAFPQSVKYSSAQIWY